MEITETTIVPQREADADAREDFSQFVAELRAEWETTI